MQGTNWTAFGSYGSGQGEFINPCGICLDQQGRIYVADQGNDLDLALSYAQKAKSKAPADPMIADTLGFVYLKKNLPLCTHQQIARKK